MNRTLQMIFVNELGRNVTIAVADPRDDLTPAQVSAVMADLIARDAFSSTGGSLVGAVSARIVSRGVDLIFG